MVNKNVIFENDGEIDIRSITTFGVSVKETENPIGYFGTGLKYALSIILRSGAEVSIYSGLTKLRFTLEKQTVRGKEFELIMMNGAELSFTTELGKNWQMWQAFREIYCNCIDENGKTFAQTRLPKAKEGKTIIVIKGEEFFEQFVKRDSIVLNTSKMTPIIDSIYGDVFEEPSLYAFYRGVRIAMLRKESPFTYNIKTTMTLTEDRTLKYSWEHTNNIEKMVIAMPTRKLASKVLNASEGFFEADLTFNGNIQKSAMSEAFFDCLEEDYNLNKDSLNKSAADWYRKFKNNSSIKNYDEAELTAVELLQLTKCKKICSNMYSNFDSYPIKIVKSLGESTMALADRELNTIIISKRCFTLGTKYLFSTMLEEYYHLSTGYNDMTREFQTYLFDTISTLVESHVIQEPI
jgi:hypothetical protein